MNLKDILNSSSAAAAVGSVGNIIGSLYANKANTAIMREQQRFAAEQAKLERDFAASQMRAQMGYNSPVNQLSMMRGAGLNVMGDSVNPMSATPTSGAAAVAPGSPQMSMDVGAGNLANLISAMAQLNASEAAGRQAGVSERKAPSEIEVNRGAALASREAANLSSANAVSTDYMRQLLGAQVSAETQNTLVNTEKTRLENQFYPALVGSQIGLNNTQARELVNQVANQLASVRMQLAVAKVNASATRYAADQAYKVGYGNVLMRKSEFEFNMSKFNKEFGLELDRFRSDLYQTMSRLQLDATQQMQVIQQWQRQFDGLGTVWNFMLGTPSPFGGSIGVNFVPGLQSKGAPRVRAVK